MADSILLAALDLLNMKHKKSYPDLRKASDPTPEVPISEPSPQPSTIPSRSKPPVPTLRDKTSVPRMKDRSASAPLPKTPKRNRIPLSPMAPDSPAGAARPRFMSLAEAGQLETPGYLPRAKYTVPKYPTIMGITPTRLKPKAIVEAKREPRALRLLKALKNPDMVKKKWKGTVRDFVRMRMMKRLNGCVRAFHAAQAKEVQKLEDTEPSEIEYRPIYRLKEMKRASLLGLPKSKRQRPMSVASMRTMMSTVDRRRYSEASVYSRHLSTAQFSPGNFETATGEASSEEDLSLRASLIPYREWWTFLQSRANPFVEDNNSFNDEQENISLDASATTIHSKPHHSHRCFSLYSPHSFPQQNYSAQDSFDVESQEIGFSSPPSPTSSELTITPSRFTFSQSMDAEENGFSKKTLADPAGSRSLEGEQKAEGAPDKGKGTDLKVNENKSDLQARQNPSTSMASQQEPAQKQANFKDTNVSDNYGSRIPRGPVSKPYSGLTKGSRPSSDHRSGIPISTRRQSADAADLARSIPSEKFIGGIRTLDQQPGPRSRSDGEASGHSISGSIQDTRKPSATSSSVSSWDLSEDDMPKAPTVFTGEYRTRLSEKKAQHRYGPTLKIAGSAENIIMGTDNCPTSSIVTQRSPKSLVRYVDMSNPSQQESDDETREQIDQAHNQDDHGQEHPANNDCRPQASHENMPKKDISNRELSVARKPLSRPSLTNPLVETAEKQKDEGTPPVPKLSVTAEDNVHNSSPLSEMKKVDADTPSQSPPQNGASSAGTTPEPIRKNMDPLRSHPPPPRTSSLQAVTNFSMHSESNLSPKTPTEVPAEEEGDGPLNEEVTFDSIAGARASKEQPQFAEAPRFLDSKSNRMLDSFRNMFKHKGTEKNRIKKEESDQVPALPKEQSTASVKSIKAKHDNTEYVKASLKGKNKYPKLDTVGWNKVSVSRDPKTSGENSPAFVPTPTSTLSASFPTPNPLTRNPADDRTPSFARPTKSTRTKAASGPKPQPPSTGQEGRPRRVMNVAASTGSPQRPTRVGTKRHSIASTSYRPGSRVVSPSSNQENVTPGSAGVKQQQPQQQPELIQKSLNDIRACISKLCNKARDEGTPSQREKYLRLALSLQQQLSDFNSVEKETSEAQIMFNTKKNDKDSVRNTLLEYFAQVQIQLEEE